MKIQTKTKEHLHSKNENVSARKQAKGITLIALVITIIVLLILAGVTIAMLTGQNGILTNATNANSSSVYYGAEEQVKLAYMSVRTQIMTEKVANSTYDATDNITTDSQGKTNVEKLKDIVKNDLNAVDGTSQTKDFGVEIGTNPDDASKPAIKIVYKNSKIYAGTISANKPSQNGQVEYYITLEPQSAGLKADGVTLAEVSDAGSGGTGGGGNQTGGLTGVDFGEKTASTIEAGEDLTIGTESFRVLSKSASQIIAVPFYNITLVTPEENNGAYPEQTEADSGNITQFSSGAFWTWGTDTIDMTDSRNKIQKYITAYSTKMSNTTNGKVTARVARYSEMDASGVTDAIRNPGQRGTFWLGSGFFDDETGVWDVDNTRQCWSQHL